MDPGHELVGEHIQAGGRGVVLESGMKGQMITIYDRGAHIPLLWTHLIPATLEGRATHNVQNAMFAASIAFSLGVKLDAIRQGLRTFDTTFFQAPGRMNVFNEHPFKVLFDYGHNAHAVGMLADLAGRLEVTGRRIVVLAGPGDRRDEDLRAIARAVAGRFDHYVCRRDDNLRDRGPDEVPRIMAAELLAAGVPQEAISVIPDEQAAIDAALRMGRPGDLLLVFADALVRSWKQIIYFRPDGAAGEAPAPVAQPALPVVEAPESGSIWSGLDPSYRLPVLVLYLALVLTTAVWPSRKNLGELIALSAALLLASQFWYLDKGGTLVVLYLPLVLLMIFRPRGILGPRELSDVWRDWRGRSRKGVA